MATFVLFESGEKLCALPQGDVVRVALIPALARPPAAPPALAGFLDLAGEAIPVVDAAALFGSHPGKARDPLYRHVLILTGRLGLLVDRVDDVRALDLSAARPADEGATLNGCVTSVLGWGEEAIHILDRARILTAAEQTRLAQLLEIEQVRLGRWAAP